MSDIKKELISWAKTILFAFVFAMCINKLIIVNATVPTGSMENTIMPKDRVVAFRLSYLFSDPERYDIIVFRYPDNETELYVKRIIGMPGETVEISQGKVYLNGSDTPLDDYYIKETQMVQSDMHFEVPEGHYFMMGDNRNNSDDSRRWINSYVNKEKILGKVVFRYYPKFTVYKDLDI